MVRLRIKQKQRKHARLRKRRKVFTVAAVLLAVCSLVIACKGRDNGTAIEYDTYIVHEGDTLWDIAVAYQSSDLDTRKVVYEIEQLNSISHSLIHRGDRLIVPVYNK